MLQVFVIVLLLSLVCSSFLLSLKLLLLKLFALDFILSIGIEMKSVENERFFNDSNDFISGGAGGELAEVAGKDPLRVEDLLDDDVVLSVR